MNNRKNVNVLVFYGKNGYNRTREIKEESNCMEVSREELLHIANLADLNLKEEEVENYLLNLQDILNFANIVSKAPVENLTETIGANDNYNVFRKDEVKVFEDNEALLSNAPEAERNMFKIPKVL